MPTPTLRSDARLLSEGAGLIGKCWPAPGNFLGARRITPGAISGTWVGPSRFIGGLLAGLFSSVDFDRTWVDRVIDLHGLLKDLTDYDVHAELMTEVFATLHKNGEGGASCQWFFSNGKGTSMYLEMCAAVRNKWLALQSLEGQLDSEHLVRFETDLLYMSRVLRLYNWYSEHREALASIHYGPWGISPAARFTGFLDAVLEHQFRQNEHIPLPVCTGPLWWGFREWFKAEYHIDLEADQKQEPGSIPAPQKSKPAFPPQYPTWTLVQRIVWDINNGHHRMSPEAKLRAQALGRPVQALDLPFILGSQS